MTYRNKIIIRRALVVLAIAAAIVFVILLIGFTYLGRFVVYTEDGAHFSFREQTPETSASTTLPVPSEILLVTGEPVPADEVIGDQTVSLEDTEVKGGFVDYATLADGTTLNLIDLEPETCNTLMLEMRGPDRALLSTESVRRLIERAKNQETWLVAQIACLSDTQYAQAHKDQALTTSAGTPWVADGGTYWLDPDQDAVIDYLADIIRQLADMGFDEVVLDDFYMPSSDMYEYAYQDRSNADITTDAYRALTDRVLDQCRIGLLIRDADAGHQAMEAADRLYVRYNDGGSVKGYAESHQDHYLVFVTDSHDTRFDAYGKIRASGEYTVETEPEPSDDMVSPAEPTEESDNDEYDQEDDA